MVKKVVKKSPPTKKKSAKAAKKSVAVAKKSKNQTALTGRLLPPSNGTVVRFYRIGHGDCFLIAFSGSDPKKPVYVLIDCGYKPGSPQMIHPDAPDGVVKAITANIAEATGGHIDVAVITHEHQDHVNAITETNFKGITIGTHWLAWTEDPKDPIANQLRKLYKDKLLGLVAARNQLAASGDSEQLRAVDNFLSFELGGETEEFNPAAAKEILLGAVAGEKIPSNKKSMKVFKDLAKNGVKTLRPHEEILTIPGATGLRVYSFGPPRKIEKLQDLTPDADAGETFSGQALAFAGPGNYFSASAKAIDSGVKPGERNDIPFAENYFLSRDDAYGDQEYSTFFSTYYGRKNDPAFHTPMDLETADSSDDTSQESALNAEWRRIDSDWLYSSEQLALAMNNDTNNSSLVLAFELGKGGKVLLFAGDAQRGNWRSWADGNWNDDGNVISTKELMSRTVLYKVGHHCSHNATLNGNKTDDYPNLSWMGTGKFANEFTSMITAVRAWAETQKGWDHPQKDIKDALLAKGAGRVLQTDTDLTKMKKPDDVSSAEWSKFLARTVETPLYFDYYIDS